jgi:hypothetical protein
MIMNRLFKYINMIIHFCEFDCKPIALNSLINYIIIWFELLIHKLNRIRLLIESYHDDMLITFNVLAGKLQTPSILFNRPLHYLLILSQSLCHELQSQAILPHSN